MKWETPMNGRTIAVTASVYAYPLLIKQLLHAPLAQTAHQEIVYRDVRRFTYAELRDRIGRLASLGFPASHLASTAAEQVASTNPAVLVLLHRAAQLTMDPGAAVGGTW
jgi:hypothetical protein